MKDLLFTMIRHSTWSINWKDQINEQSHSMIQNTKKFTLKYINALLFTLFDYYKAKDILLNMDHISGTQSVIACVSCLVSFQFFKMIPQCKTTGVRACMVYNKSKCRIKIFK